MQTAFRSDADLAATSTRGRPSLPADLNPSKRFRRPISLLVTTALYPAAASPKAALTNRKLARKLPTVIAASLLFPSAFPSRPAVAQQVVANGTAQTASGTINTGVQPPPAGYALWALNGGSINSLSPLTLITGGDFAFAARAESGGSITLFNGSSATTSGFTANVLSADGAGSIITATNPIIVANGNSAYGAVAGNGGTINLTGGTIDTFGTAAVGHGMQALSGGSITASGMTVTATGFGAYAFGGTISLDTMTFTERLATGNVAGLRSDLPSGLITANNLTITTSGANSFGAVTTDGGRIDLSNSSINTSGSGAFGLNSSQSNLATGTPSLLNATNVTVTTTGLAGHGVLIYNGAVGNLNNVTIQTSGPTAFGIDVLGFIGSGPPIATVLNGTNVTVATTGDGAYGAIAVAAGTLNLTDSSLTAMGPNAGGLAVSDPGSVATLLRTTATSAQLDAVLVDLSGHFFATDSTLTGARHGVLSTGGTVADPNIAVVSGGTLTAAADAFNAQDSIAQLTLSNGTAVTTGSGNLLNVISTDPATFTSNVTFTTQNITATGNIISDAASTTTVNLTSNSTITGIEQNTFTTVDGSSNWIMNGNSNIFSLTLAGQVNYTPPTGDPTLLASYKTLTTVNYIGQGGTIGLNTFLGDDTSPSDRLVINGGTATGSSLLRIANTIGPGAQTTGNGILVVDTINAGTTVPGTFALAGPVVAGPYEYSLFRSSVDPSNPEAWYLRSTLDCTLDPSSPICPAPTPPPDFRPETSLYAALPSMALIYGRTLLDTLHERVGEEEHLRGKPRLGGPWTGFWGRVIGQHGNHDGDPLGIFGSGPKFDYTLGAFQAGRDLYRQDSLDGGRDHGGVYGAIGRINGKITHFDRTRAGNDELNAYSLGGYWTHFGPSGWYLDAIVQGTWYDASGISGRLPTMTTNGWGIAGSLEGGVPIRLGNGFFVEPQAQLVYQRIDLNDSHDVGASIRFDDVDSLAGRVGARLGRTWALVDAATPRLITAWFRPNLWYEFRGDPKTSFSSATGFIPFRSDLGGPWLELNGGVSGQISAATELYANVSYQTRFDGDAVAYNGKAGLRMHW